MATMNTFVINSMCPMAILKMLKELLAAMAVQRELDKIKTSDPASIKKVERLKQAVGLALLWRIFK